MAQDSLAFQPFNRMPAGTFASLQYTPKECQKSVITYGSILTYPGVAVSKLFLEAEERRPMAALTGFYTSRIIHGFLVVALLMRIVTLARQANFMPFGLTLIAGLATSPLFIQQSFGVSADSICFMFALSLMSIVFFPSLVNRFDILVAITLAAVASHTKPPMALFGISAATLGFLRYSSRRYRVAVALLAAASVLGAMLVSFSFGSATATPQEGPKVISVGQQLAFALRNPPATYKALDAAVWTVFTLEQLAHPLGWLDTYLHKRALMSWYIMLWIALGFEILGLLVTPWSALTARAASRAFGQSSIYLVGVYAASIATPLILYLSWTAVGATGVEGMQSRYLFPSLLLLPAAIAPFYALQRASTDSERRFSFCIENAAIVLFMAILTALYVSELHITITARYW